MIGKIALLLLSLTSSTITAAAINTDNHQLEFGFRPRLATVDSNVDADAASVLLRVRLESEWSDAFSSKIEVDHVHLWWEDKFSNGVNFNETPVIPDVAGTDLNQLVVYYRPTNTLTLSAGREAVNLGNQRFIGTNSWWQNEQTLDGVGVEWAVGSASTLSYRYVGNANRINGEDATRTLSPDNPAFEQYNGLRPPQFLGDHSHDSHLFWAEYRELDNARLQGYYFDIDIEEAAALSNRTLGGRFEYKQRVDKTRWFGHAEFAVQERPKVNSGSYTQYFNIGAGVGYLTHELSVNAEQLGEHNGSSFVTPLASLHEANGWVDKFLITPSSGLDDYSVRYIWRLSPWKIDMRYHWFNRDDTNSAIGKELDIDVSLKIAHNNIVILRFADFNSQAQNYTNERRLFLQYIYNL